MLFIRYKIKSLYWYFSWGFPPKSPCKFPHRYVQVLPQQIIGLLGSSVCLQKAAEEKERIKLGVFFVLLLLLLCYYF